MNFHSRIKDDQSHRIVKTENNIVTVQRLKPPRLKLSYNIESKDYELLDQGEVSDDKINIQVKKTIAWIKSNVRP